MQIKNLKQKLLITAAVLLFILLLYSLHITCPFLAITGIPCPGCGMTRALISALKLDFGTAFSYHRMFWSVPFLYIAFLLDGRLFKSKPINTVFFVLIGTGFVINWLLP